MRIPSSSIATFSIALILSLPFLGAASAAVQSRQLEESVWIGWSAAAMAPDEGALESIPFEMPSGKNTTWALSINNAGEDVIQNATVVLTKTAGVARYEFGPTYAGDPPLEDYAYWRVVESNGTKLVPFSMEVATVSQEQPFRMEFLTFYERAGVPSVARTVMTGVVVPGPPTGAGFQSEGPAEGSTVSGATPVGIVLVVLLLALLMHRKRN